MAGPISNLCPPNRSAGSCSTRTASHCRTCGSTATRAIAATHSAIRTQQGEFTISGVPVEVTLEKFEIWTRDEHFIGKVESTEPLVVRVQPK